MVLRRRNYLRPVNTIKHIVDVQGGIVAGTQVISNLVKTVDNPVSTSAPAECTTGSHVKSFFLNVQVAATGTAALANVYMFVFGNPGDNIIDANIDDGNVIGVSDIRKQVFHQEMIMTEKNTTAFPRTLFRGVIKVPRKFNRLGVKDRISIALFSPGVNYDFCFQCIYKEIK